MHCRIRLWWTKRYAILIFLLIQCARSNGFNLADTVKLVRGVDLAAPVQEFNVSDSNPNSSQCSFAGSVSVSHPISMHSTDRFFSGAQLCLSALQMMVDYVNFDRCGVHLSNGNYSIILNSYSDESSFDKTTQIGEAIVNKTDFLFGGFSSFLTGALAPIAQAAGKVLMTGASIREDVYENRDWVFGTLPPGFLKDALEGLAAHGARSVATVYEDMLVSCNPVPELASRYGLNFTSANSVGISPNAKDLFPVVQKISQEDSDVVVTCAYEKTCAEWIKAMREAHWSPKAQVFTLCIGTAFEVAAGDDLEYMMAALPWYRTVPAKDAITGWSAEEFGSLFEETTFRNASYHAAGSAAGLSVLVQAMEETNSIAPIVIKDHLYKNHFMTMYGNISFDENGQNANPSVLLQYDSLGTAHPVYPPEQSYKVMTYPMPSWNHRDCMKRSKCAVSGGACQEDGRCSCFAGDDVSLGIGANATCKTVPEEDLTLFDSSVVIVGTTLVSIQGVFSFSAILWTLVFRKKRTVRAGQPVFLVMISLGCFLIACAIIPMARQAGYRYNIDFSTGSPSAELNETALVADRACMAEPWLYGMGFCLTFSALFAKIARVKRIFHTRNFVKKKVTAKDVTIIMAVLLSFQGAILLSWQLTYPFLWQRHVVMADSDGFPLKSVGRCTSSKGWYFYIATILFQISCLLYALYLCFVTRKIPSTFSESKYVAAAVVSMLQILVLALPTLNMVVENTDAFYFVRACLKFLMSATVTLLIFAPKIYSCHWQGDGERAFGAQRVTTTRATTGTAGGTATVADRANVTRRRSSFSDFYPRRRLSLGGSSEKTSEIPVRETAMSRTSSDAERATATEALEAVSGVAPDLQGAREGAIAPHR